MASNKQNDTNTNQGVSGGLNKKLKSPEASGFYGIQTMASNENTLFRKLIIEELLLAVPDDEETILSELSSEQVEEIVENTFNNYNQTIMDAIKAKTNWTTDDLNCVQEVIDEAVDEFGYDLIKDKDLTQRLELFIYLEARRIAAEVFKTAAAAKVTNANTDEVTELKKKLADAEKKIAALKKENIELEEDIVCEMRPNGKYEDLYNEVVERTLDEFCDGGELSDQYDKLVGELREEWTCEILDELHEGGDHHEKYQEIVDEVREEFREELTKELRAEMRPEDNILEGRRQVLDALNEWREAQET